MYAFTAFLGAFLLFELELLAGQTLLPFYGGGYQVWTVCLVFFQGLLLAGYYYAHKVPSLFRKGGFPRFHAALALAAWAIMPVSFPVGQWAQSPATDLFLKLCWQLGLPFLVLSSTATLTQRLYLLRSDAPGQNPYPLYAWSNIGSLLGLAGFPLGLELIFSLEQNWLLWRALFGCYAALILVLTLRRYNLPGDGGQAAADVPAQDRTLWFLLPAASGALLITATNHIALSTASISLMWTVPLAIYLFTFALFFMETRWTRHILLAVFLLIGLWAASVKAHGGGLDRWLFFAINTSLACVCLGAHWRLFLLKPRAENLSSYYLHISAGGFAGTLALSLLLPFASRYIYARMADLLIALSVLALCADLLLSYRWRIFRWKPVTIAVLAPLLLYFHNTKAVELYSVRNFYGLYRVLDVPGTRVREFLSGVTLHGEQDFAPGKENEPMRYYSRTAPSGELFGMFAPDRVGLVGLGVGSLTPYAEKGTLWVYFELDPDVVEIAQKYFSFLSQAKGEVLVVPGDARKSLEKVPDGFFDLIVVDAFSGGGIPAHLLTMEAMSLYRDKTANGGVVALHISNAFFSLRKAAENAAAGAGFVTAYRRTRYDETFPSQWLVATRNRKLLERLYAAGWSRPLAKQAAVPWTDGKKNLISAIRTDQ